MASRPASADVPETLLPGDLLAAGTPGPHPRTLRDWLVDSALFLWAVAWWAVMLAVTSEYHHLPDWVRAADAPLGALACLSLWWRRRWPLGTALLAVVPAALANSMFGAGMVIILNLALRVPWRRSVPVLLLFVVATAPYVLLYSVPHEGGWATAVFVLAYHLVFFAWGCALRARRMLVLRLREDVERERAEHARKLLDTRRAEGAAIAREMHDVLAHRISLLSVHAGALLYRSRRAGSGGAPALSDAELVESAQVIRDNAHQALDELRQVLHVLRADEHPDPATAPGTAPGPGAPAAAPADGYGTGGTAPPQPRLADVGQLADEARAAGQQIDLRTAFAPGAVPGALRPRLQRTAYRVVQEGLTNARKHAPGARLSVLLSGSPGRGLTVEVGNPLPVGVTATEIPGAGAGLTGLAERVELEGGVLEHGSTDGVFTLRARLPWP
ncbi:histidine kinase [Streptomyces sp. NPDC005805]|uniref:sensor histidine kinase n=1 Tax=Streptomyces sp. NPDC005805 TaxID=3157068 RepID=UPI0033DE9AA4